MTLSPALEDLQREWREAAQPSPMPTPCPKCGFPRYRDKRGQAVCRKCHAACNRRRKGRPPLIKDSATTPLPVICNCGCHSVIGSRQALTSGPWLVLKGHEDRVPGQRCWRARKGNYA